MSKYKKDERCSTITSGLIMLGIGLFFLAVNMDIFPPVRDSWPIILIVVGLATMFGGIFKKRRDDENLPPGGSPPQ